MVIPPNKSNAMIATALIGLVLSLGFTYGGFKVLGPHSSVLSLAAPLLMLRPAKPIRIESRLAYQHGSTFVTGSDCLASKVGLLL